MYLFNKYKHNCLLKFNSLTNTSLGLDLQIKQDKDIPIKELNISEKHMTQIAIQLSNCIKKGLSNIIIPLYLNFANGYGHANLLIYRKKNNVIEHFEPYGYQYGKNAGRIKFINKKLDDFISILNKELPQQSQVQLFRANDVCPFFDGFQTLEEKSTIPKLEIQGKGYCTAWSMFFTELSLKNPNYSSNEIINIIYDKLNKLSEKDRNNYLRKIIVGYVNLIDNKIEKYFSIIFGKHVTSETITQIIKARKEVKICSSMNTILDIENALLNDPSLTKDDYLKYIKRNIKNTSNISEKNRLMAQEKMLENIDILLNASPISDNFKSTPKNPSNSISSPKSSSKSSSKKTSSSISSPELSSVSLPSSKSSVKLTNPSSSQESNTPINLVELDTLLPSKSKSHSQKSSRASFFKSAFKSNSPSSKNITQKSKSSLTSSLKSSISSLKKSVNTIEDVSFSIDQSTNSKSSSTKGNNSLNNSLHSLQSSISSLTDSLNSLEDKNSEPSSKKSSSNEENTRCENKKLKPCSETQIRNPITCRCNNITAKRKVKKVGCENKKLNSCSEKKIRNPITCRCNKIKVNNTRKRKICDPEKLGPCTNNRVRNSVTCRCRKKV